MPALKGGEGPQDSATALLIACLVQTLQKSDSTFQSRFLETLGRTYKNRSQDGADPQELQTLSQARDFLASFLADGGQEAGYVTGDNNKSGSDIEH